ncbi:helix-turn-helix domain-containing protein [Microbacterium rhizomatis]|uniref:ImmA/IrrE family metallo-endopeptidase n=1 Tax=Microbacterium rhizomatis TaxID=1631477 RepID=A0A5J5IZK4_9MICO|nr:XRE family transcriptional regulator [Microbacterium rhizomatis]KAA9104784.1 ImmA/IrrE family metallo-endopeptidase [Microbacterium rhizomatis]
MVDGTRIRDGRVLMNVTQADLAKASNLQQPLISMIERGDRMASEDQLAAISNALGLPSSFFQFRQLSGPGASPEFRRMKTARSKDTEQARQLFKEAFRISEQLLDGSGYPQPTLPVVDDREAELSIDRIEEIAQETRAAWGLDSASPLNHLVRTMERRGIVVCPLVLPGEEEPLYGEGKSQHFGASYWLGVGETAVVAIFPGSSGDRDRFTTAHEAGHMILHTFRPAVDPDVKEREANLFAGALLAPSRAIAGNYSETMGLKALAEMKAKWGLSMQALVMRGRQLEVLSSERSQGLFRQISARGWRKGEPVQVPHEAPKLLRKLLERRYGATPFAGERVVDELGLPTAMLRSLAPDPLGSREQERDNVSYVNFQSRERTNKANLPTRLQR